MLEVNFLNSIGTHICNAQMWSVPRVGELVYLRCESKRFRVENVVWDVQPVSTNIVNQYVTIYVCEVA